jgi:hypothetical protein
MRRIIAVLAATLPLILSAQALWQNEGVPVFHSENIKWDQSTSISTGDAVIDVWVDSRNGYPQIFAQRINGEGEPQWAPGGVAVSTSQFSNCVTSSSFIPPQLVASGQDVIIIWLENKFTSQRLIAQKVQSDGTLAWNQPAQIALYETGFSPVAVSSDANGGAYVVWNASQQLYASHITSDGTIGPEFLDNGIRILQPVVQPEDVKLIAKQNGDLVVVALAGEASCKDVIVQSMTSHGLLMFGLNGQLLLSQTASPRSLAIASNGDDLNYLFWRDFQSHLFFALLFDSEATALWNAPVILSTNPLGSNVHAVLTSDMSAIFSWENGYLYAQKIDATGTTLWGETGRSLTPMGVYSDSDLQADVSGGMWLSFRNQNTIRLQHISAPGDLHFPLAGRVICNQAGQRIKPALRTMSQDGLLLSWQDWRNGSGELYYQTLNANGQPQLTPNGEQLMTGLDCAISEVHLVDASLSPPLTLWADTRHGNSHYFFQELQGNGYPYYQAYGRPITALAEGKHEQLDARFDQQRSCYQFIWKQSNNDAQTIRTQAVDWTGTYLWSDGAGVQLSYPGISVNTPFISGLDDEVYCSWSGTDWPVSAIFIQRLDNGEPQWGTYGRELVVNMVGRQYEIVGLHGRYLVWNEDDELHVLHFNEDGFVADGWEPDGQVVGNSSVNPYIGVSDEGLVVLWFNNGKIMEQIVTPQGDLLLPDGGKVLANAANGSFSAIVGNDLLLSWLSYDATFMLQNFSLSGEPQWPGTGIEVAPINSFINPLPQMVSVESSVAITWNQMIDDVMGIKLAVFNVSEAEPTLLLDEVLCSHHFGSYKPLISVMEDNTLYISWKDSRGAKLTPEQYIVPSSIYAQRFSLDVLPAANTAPALQAVLHNYPNPFNPTTTIRYTLSDYSVRDLTITIYNARGQKLKESAVTIGESGEGLFTWDGRDDQGKPASSGVYLYSLSADGSELAQQKMLLLK